MAAKLSYIPLKAKLKDGQHVLIDHYNKETDENDMFRIMKEITEERNSYPMRRLNSKDEFGFTWFTKDADVIVCRIAETKKAIGAFNVISAFKAYGDGNRSSHYADGNFIVDSQFRGIGVGRLLVLSYFYVARDLGFRASRIVAYSQNNIAINLYKKLGFKEYGRLPEAGDFADAGEGYVEMVYMYYNLLDLKGVPSDLEYFS